jgi:hypothetical protein
MRNLILALALISACSNPSVVMPDAPTTFQDVQNDPNNVDGMHFATLPFDVPQSTEVQDCYFMNMPDLNNGQPYWIDHIRLGTNPGSHHMNVFRVKTIVNLGTPEQGNFVHGVNGMGECFKSGNWGDWPLVANTQISSSTNPYFDWHLPDNVAYQFNPGERIMIQTHYVNASTQTTPFRGKVVVDMYKSKLTAPMEMGTLFATEQNIRICQSNPTPSYHGACAFKNGGVTIAAANGHFHSRGVEFDVFKWDGASTSQPPDGDRFYQSLTWNDPPMMIYSNPTGMQITPNGGIWWTCDYQWIAPSDAAGGCAAVDARDPQHAGDCCYTFGPIVETSEHCNVFLYYYPKVAGTTDIQCF